MLYFLILLLSAPFVLTQTTSPVQVSTNTSNGATNTTPDVVFNVPNLTIGQLNLTTSNFTARAHLDVNTANLVMINAGVDIMMDQLVLSLTGLQTQINAAVHLDNIVTIVNRTLTSLDMNPSLFQNNNCQCAANNQTNLTQSGMIVLQDLINTEGQHVVTMIDQYGNITLNLINSTGMIIESIFIGNYTTEMMPTGVIPMADNGNGTMIVQYIYPPTGVLVDIMTQNGNVTSVTQGQASNPNQNPTNQPTTSTPTLTPTTGPNPTNTPTESPTTEIPTTIAPTTEFPTTTAPTSLPTETPTTLPTVVVGIPTTTEFPTTGPTTTTGP